MPKSLIGLVLTGSLFLGGCGGRILMRPAVDDVKRVAVVSVYMNRDFYNIKSPKSSEGGAALGSLLEAAGKVVAEKLGKNTETDFMDDVDPERLKILAYGLSSYNKELGAFGRWEAIPVETVIANKDYQALKQETGSSEGLTGTLTRLVGAYSEQRQKEQWVTPPGMHFFPISSVIKDSSTRNLGESQDPTEAARQALAGLCTSLNVDAVALLQVDMAYRFNKLGKITIFTRTLAVPSVSASLVVINKNGEIAVNTGAIVRGQGDRYEGDTVGMVQGDAVVLTHKDDKVVQNYSLALDKASAGLAKRLAKAFEKN